MAALCVPLSSQIFHCTQRSQASYRLLNFPGVRFEQRNHMQTRVRRRIMAKEEDDDEEEDETKKKADEYSATFQEITKSDLTYRHELGMNYARILPNVIVGSCLQNPVDLDRLRQEEDVTTVCNLQQDPDMAYFNVDISSIRERAKEVDGMNHVRLPIRDMDGFDLRMRLPKVIASLYQELKEREGTMYVHCTAGLGRAPAVALAYMYWVMGYQLNEAYSILLSKRKCVPSMENIRAATCDLIVGMARNPISLQWRRGLCDTVELAGLDIGWHERLGFTYVRDRGWWKLDHELPVGRYEYKYVIDKERWTYNPDAPITREDDKGRHNNYVEVVDGSIDSENWLLRKQLMKEDAVLSEEQRSIILQRLEELGSEL